MIQAAAYLATAVILVTYFRVQRGHSSRAFDWANAIGCVPLAISACLFGAYPSAIVSGTFGAIAWYGLISHRHADRRTKRWVREISRSRT